MKDLSAMISLGDGVLVLEGRSRITDQIDVLLLRSGEEHVLHEDI